MLALKLSFFLFSISSLHIKVAVSSPNPNRKYNSPKIDTGKIKPKVCSDSAAEEKAAADGSNLFLINPWHDVMKLIARVRKHGGCVPDDSDDDDVVSTGARVAPSDVISSDDDMSDDDDAAVEE